MMQQQTVNKAKILTAELASMPQKATDKTSNSRSQKGSSTEETVVIESRFGQIKVELKNAIFFPQGLLGLPDNLHFALSDIPKENMGRFKLLQCLNDHSLSFVVLPLSIDNTLIARKDLEECCQATSIQEADLLALLIVSVQRAPDSVKVTANVRAPVVIDTSTKMAMQYVFPSNKYEICHVLS